MSASQTVSWGGYKFTAYEPDQTDWNDVPGIYIFAGTSSDGRWWQAKYIGQTLSFKDRLGPQINNHERWPEAVSHGATHIHARVVQSEKERRTLEYVLIDSFNPPLNAT